MKLRFGLLRHIYTRYMLTSLYGGSLIRPILFDFPEDPNIFKFIDTTFMIGK